MKKITLFLGALGFLAGSASAAIVTIDPFNQPPVPAQQVCAGTPCTGLSSTNGATGLDTIFGARWMSITQTSGTDQDTGDVDQGTTDALSFNNASASCFSSSLIGISF